MGCAGATGGTRGTGAFEFDDVEPTVCPGPRNALLVLLDEDAAAADVPAGFTVSGIVYDVATGLVETVVPAARLRI